MREYYQGGMPQVFSEYMQNDLGDEDDMEANAL